MWPSPRAGKKRVVVRLDAGVRVEEADRRPAEEEIAETEEAETDPKERERSRVNLKGSGEPPP